MQVWRLCQVEYADSAWSGEGAWRFSGRWNPAGFHMIYAASSIALAAMELFLHTDPRRPPPDLILVSAIIPMHLSLEKLDASLLPKAWDKPDSPVCQPIGAQWIASKRSVALSVPSVAVQGDWNVLLNPAHPEFSQIDLLPPKPWRFDPRVFR